MTLENQKNTSTSRKGLLVEQMTLKKRIITDKNIKKSPWDLIDFHLMSKFLWLRVTEL